MTINQNSLALRFAITTLMLLTLLQPTYAVEHILANIKGRQQQLSGKVIVEDSAGSVLLKTDDGAMWPIMASDIHKRKADTKPLAPLNKKQLAERLLEEMGPGFQVHDSKNYVIVFNTTRKYAIWCSATVTFICMPSDSLVKLT